MDAPTETETPPKVFISYRWTSPAHEEWVLNFATLLRSSGIDALLDKWHLREGQDTLAFMESMVRDPTVKKVLMICDAGYVERANNRSGGVGTEAQIVSAKVYNDVNQDKFAAVVTELDELGKPLLPIYMSTRLYFDMSSIESSALNFEKIVRWIFDQPFHSLPPIGRVPDFLGKTYTTGSPLFGSDAVGNNFGLQGSNGAENVLAAIADESECFRLKLANVPNAENLVYDTIKGLKPVLENAYLSMRNLISKESPFTNDKLHNFLERLSAKIDWRVPDQIYSRWDNDVYKYFCHDVFVSFVSICMESKRFDLCSDILSTPMFKPMREDLTGKAVDYTEFRHHLLSLDEYSRKLGHISVHADLLHELHENSIVSRTSFMEADLTLHIRGLLHPSLSWYPVSALYLALSDGALPTYVRAKSKRFYNRLKSLLFDTEAFSLKQYFASEASKESQIQINYSKLDIPRLISLGDISTVA